MGRTLADPGEGGNGPENNGGVLCHVCAGNTDIRIGDLGGDPPHDADPGGVPPPGGALNHKEYAK